MAQVTCKIESVKHHLLVTEHVSQEDIDKMVFVNGDIMTKGDQINPSVVVGHYRCFGGIDRPLFCWVYTMKYGIQHTKLVDGKEVPDYRLYLSRKKINPIFEVILNQCSKEFVEFIRLIFNETNPDHPRYIIRENAGACLLSPVDRHPRTWYDADWILIEFFRPEGAQAFVDYINQHYAGSLTRS